MKKIFTLIGALTLSSLMFAGGIVTNTNQSAAFIRMLSRNATTDFDAVYYNPAGLTLLNDGFHVSLNNQSVFQEKIVTTNFPYLNNQTYVGDVTVPFFPTFFGVYKKDKWAVSFGFGPNGGGGSAEYAQGLPSFEMPIAMIPVALSASGIPTTAYTADITFSGSSIYWGGQLGFSYQVHDHISLSAGVRVIKAKNTYEGHIKDIMIDPTYAGLADGSMVSATDFFSGLSTYLSGVSTQAYGAATSMDPLVNGGAADFTFADAETAGLIDAATRAQLEGGLLAMGSTQADIDAMTLGVAQGTYNAYGAGFGASADEAEANAAATEDMVVDAQQTGTAFTGIFGANFNLLDDKLNVAVKYEMNTMLELTNTADADKDANGMFKNDSTFRSDIPAFLALGVNYQVLEKLMVSASWNHYFDKNANWNGKEKFIDKNLYEFALGMEYDVNELLTVSAGYSHGQTGVGQGYQTDLSFSNSSNTVGFGGRINATEKLSIDLGASFTMYTDDVVESTYLSTIPYKETFDKKTTTFAIGLNYSF